MTPWQLLLRYRYTILWLGFICYLIFVYRITQGHW